MATIQVVLDTKLLRATDRAARRTKQNRSALIREALSEHLRRLDVRVLKEQERAAYIKHPRQKEEWLAREREAVWPED